MEEKFLLPGRDGELDPSTNIWRKGIVFTTWSDVLNPAVKPGYRVSVGFKKSVSAGDSPLGFQALYERVTFIANQRMSGVAMSNPASAVGILSHGWRLLGEEGKVATAFVTLILRSPEERDSDVEQLPSNDDLRTPGGTSLEDLSRLGQHHPEEIYSEFDFTNSSVPGSDFITVSYAECIPEIPEGDPFDFTPYVERAEVFANSYHKLLQRYGEVISPFQTIRREWLLVDRKLVTVHICFNRQASSPAPAY